LEYPKSCIFFYHRGDNFGPPVALDRYLKEEMEKYVAARFPLGFARKQFFEIALYSNGNLEYEKKVDIKREHDEFWYGDKATDIILEITNQIKALLKIAQVTQFGRKKFDVGIGADPVCAYSVSLLRNMGMVKKAVYANYNDVTPLRSNNNLFNALYARVVKSCLTSADYVWYRWENHRNGVLAKYGNIKERAIVMVPHGVYLNQNHALPKINNHKIVSAKATSETAGIQLLIEVMPDLLKVIPDLEFIVVGTGKYLPTLQQLAKEKGVENNVKFYGQKTHEETLQIVNECSVGYAAYVPTKFRKTMEADSALEVLGSTTSTMEMLGASLPIICTIGMGISYEVRNENAGIAIEWSPKEMYDTVIKILSDNERYKIMSANARKLATKYEWQNIFDSALRGQDIVMNNPIVLHK